MKIIFMFSINIIQDQLSDRYKSHFLIYTPSRVERQKQIQTQTLKIKYNMGKTVVALSWRNKDKFFIMETFQ